MNVTQYDNKSKFIACEENYKKFIKQKSKLRSSTLLSKLYIKKTKELTKLTTIETSVLEDIKNINLDVIINKIIEPNFDDIPKCLSEVFKDTELYKPPNNNLDVLDSINKNIEGNVNIDTIIEDILKTTYNNRKDVELLLDKATQLICKNSGIANLFNYIRSYQEYLNSTRYSFMYMNFKDTKKCIENNCILDNEILSEDFLYYDKDKLSFIVPIDINTNKIRFFKFFSNKEINNNIKILDKEYYNYIKYIEDLLINIIKKSKIQDNAFKEYYDKNFNNEIVNTLF